MASEIKVVQDEHIIYCPQMWTFEVLRSFIIFSLVVPNVRHLVIVGHPRMFTVRISKYQQRLSVLRTKYRLSIHLTTQTP